MATHYKYGTQIKIKTGYCIDCNDGKEKPIIAGRCVQYHYQRYRAAANQARRLKREPELRDEQKLLWEWYEEKIAQMKWRCEECGDRIVDRDVKYNHWHVCHVLGKEHFPSVKTHDLNWWEGCHTCHTLFDNYMQNHDERMMQMRIFDKVVSIIQALKPFVKETRRFNNLPEFILQKIKIKKT